MKILFLTPNRKGLVGINRFYFLEKAVAKHADCKWAGVGHPRFFSKKRESIRRVVKRLYGNDFPDWVIVTACVTDYDLSYMTNPKNRPYKIGAFLTDIHNNMILERRGYRGVKGYVQALNGANFDAVFMHYMKTPFSQNRMARSLQTEDELTSINPSYFLDNLQMAICYVPPCVDTSLYKPTNILKIHDVSFLGCVTKVIYPLRRQIFYALPKLAREKKWSIINRQRPIGKSLSRKIKKMPESDIVGEEYMEVLSRSKIFIFGSSIYKYPLYKYFEGMACRTCVMADKPLTASLLHFVPDLNFVEINRLNWKKKLAYYMEHKREREEIARRGYETVMKYHTVDIRAKELIKFLEENK